MTPELMAAGARAKAIHDGLPVLGKTESGGRGSLVGPIVGAFFVNGAKSWFTQAFPEFWLYFLGALFILVTIFLPQGIIGLVRRKKESA